MSKMAVEEYLDNCQAWQKMVSAEPTRAGRIDMTRRAFRAMSIDQPHNRNIILGGDVALHVPDGTNPTEEALYPMIQYGELQSKGWLGRLYRVAIYDDILITWPVYDPNVLGPRMDTDTEELADMEHPEMHLPLDIPLQRPLHFPVGFINFAIEAGR